MRGTEFASAIVRGLVAGFDLPAKRCNQCWQWRPAVSFVSPKAKVVTWCEACRARYRNWRDRTDDERLAARAAVPRTGTGYTVNLSLRSNNRKTGPIPVSMTDQKSCPTSCAWMDQGCYAGYGKASYLWRKVPDWGLPWSEFCAQIAALPAGTLWRHNEAGDLPGYENAIDVAALAELVAANRGRRGFTFTHKIPTTMTQRIAIRRAVEAGFMVNLSADSLDEADRLADMAIAPVAVVIPQDAEPPNDGARKFTTPAGRIVIVCPAQWKDGMTCATCQICSKDREAIVAFRAHGQAKSFVSLRLSKTSQKPIA